MKETWDTYVGGGALDPNMDFSTSLNFMVNQGQPGQSDASPGSQSNGNGVYADAGLGGAPFMGVSTPPKGSQF